ncbi:hypothetical protein [Sutcliffiella horikoshii]|uniref:hypothetical protein n=1 Tax=Sutcliffiella horikoshii TaxID=79883 RepID=UPI00384D50A8
MNTNQRPQTDTSKTLHHHKNTLNIFNKNEKDLCFQADNLAFPVHIVNSLWSNPAQITYHHEDTRFIPHKELQTIINQSIKHLSYSNRYHIRCKNISVKEKNIEMTTEWVEYAHYIGTNRQIFTKDSEGKTLKEKLNVDASINLQSPYLGNELAINATFIIKEGNNKYILLTQRGKHVNVYPNRFSTSVSGAMGGEEKWLDFIKEEGNYIPDPVGTTIRETKEELGIDITRESIKLDALCLQMLDMQLNYLLTAEINYTRNEILQAWNNSVDKYEIMEPIFVPLDLDTVLPYIVYQEWSPTAAMSVIITLQKLFGEEKVINKLKALSKGE